MKFVHHDTGEWIRFDCNTAATRSDPTVHEYSNLDSIDNAWLRDTFDWMMREGLIVTQCGSNTFQIRVDE